MMALMPVRKRTSPDPCTWTGVWRSLFVVVTPNEVAVPSPSFPNQLKPQSQTVPSDLSTMQWRAPPQMDTTVAGDTVAANGRPACASVTGAWYSTHARGNIAGKSFRMLGRLQRAYPVSVWPAERVATVTCGEMGAVGRRRLTLLVRLGCEVLSRRTTYATYTVDARSSMIAPTDWPDVLTVCCA